jgi:uncharacterized protein YdiU (UPF0061 family)
LTISDTFKGETSHQSLGSDFFAPVKPADFPKAKVRFRNDAWAARVGLGDLSDPEWALHFGRFEPLPGSLPEPLALAYHGHQFRSYNPELGDGRGFLFAQMRDDQGRLLDLGTKGSGQTPWSRTADGRLTLKGGVREILATEMLEALGVNTSKTFSIIETGEELQRGDEPSPTRSAVMVRLSHSHIRIGSFQRLAALQQPENIEKLLRYSIEHYYRDISGTMPLGATILKFMEKVVQSTAATCANWMAAGFVHGVLNTDNINITGESFDYGPWRFAPTADPGFTAAYFDQNGLYAYGRQPETIFWNICRLAECFTSLISVSDLETTLETFEHVYRASLNKALSRRLGISNIDGAAMDVASNVLPALAEADTPFEDFFFDHFGGSQARLGRGNKPLAPYGAHKSLAKVSAAILECAPSPEARPSDPYFNRDTPSTLLIEEVEALWSHIDERDDWQPLYDKVEEIRRRTGL